MQWARQSPQTIGFPSLTVNVDECWRISAHGLPHFLAQKKQVDITGGLYRDNNQYLLSKDLCPNLFEVLSNKLILWSLETLQPDRHNGEDAMLQQCKFSLWTPAWDDDDEEHKDGGGGGGSGVSVKNCHGPPKVMTRNSPPKPEFFSGTLWRENSSGRCCTGQSNSWHEWVHHKWLPVCHPTMLWHSSEVHCGPDICIGAQ